MSKPSQLASRLRTETAALHARTEEQAGIPGRITTIADYARLLESMLTFHLTTELTFNDARWATEWGRLGITIGDHHRSQLIIEDLRELGCTTDVVASPPLATTSFAEALGCLYVVEGSALGGKYIGPSIVAQLGPVPITYYDGTGRAHPAPWRRVQLALSSYETNGGDPDGVISGAVDTFTLFGTIVESRGSAHERV